MRRFLVVVALLGIGLAACGGDDSAGAPSTTRDASTSASTSASSSAADAAAFPVTIEHAFGATTIEDEPERVVTLGVTDHDPVLALGVVPVGLHAWYDYDGPWPWSQAALGGAEPTVLSGDELNVEAVAALHPDLILALYAELDQAQYDQLSAIAPTVAQSGEHPAFGTPWQETTLTAGRALGREAKAQQLVDDLEGRFADIRREHPELEGVELAYAGVYGDMQYYVETKGSARVQVLLDLGFVVAPELAALGADKFYHPISSEQLELIDQQVIVWEPADASLLPALQADPLHSAMHAAQDGREVYLDDPIVAGALAHSTVASLPVALDFLVPRLTEAVAKLDH